MYSTVVRCLYQKCKCKTVWAYLQNFVMSPCMEYFQCKVARYLHDLESYGVMHLSQDESSYIDIVLGWHCNERYCIDVTMRNHFIISLFFGMGFIVGPLFALFGRVFISNFRMGYTLRLINTAIVVSNLCAYILLTTPAIL